MKALGTYLFVSNIDATVRFYTLLGLDVERVSDMFGRACLGPAVVLEFGTSALTGSYDARYTDPPEGSKGTLNFECESRDHVEEKFRELLEAGYEGYLKPIDALWQARFAIVLDPDGNQIGLHSPRSVDDDRKREGGA